MARGTSPNKIVSLRGCPSLHPVPEMGPEALLNHNKNNETQPADENHW